MTRSVVVWLLMLPAVLQAAPQTRARREAVAHHAAANRAFRAGNYEEALEQLEAGYATEPRPEFLIAFAQTYRELGRLDEAIVHCDRYLALAPRGPLVDQVRGLARELRRDMRSREEPAPDDTPKSGAPEPKTDPIEPPKPAPPLLQAVAPPPDSPRPLPSPLATAHFKRRDLAIGLVISAAGVIIGLGVGLGVGLGASPAAPPTRFGTVSFQ